MPTLEVFSGMVATIRVRGDRASGIAEEEYTLATDLADYLVVKGVPFREAHGIVSRLVQYAIDMGKSFAGLTLSEYTEFSPLFEEDVYNVTAEASIAARNVLGGTAREQVKQQLARARKIVQGEDDQ